MENSLPVDNKPTGYYAIPVGKDAFSFQPITSIRRALVSENMQSEAHLGIISGSSSSKDIRRTLTVCGTGQVSMPPDQVRLVIVVASSKASLEEARASVHRRYEYIHQTLKKHRVPEASIRVTHANYRREGAYEVTNELVVVFSDFKQYLEAYNLLVEKLDDKTVKISSPVFFHTRPLIESMKRQVMLQAIRNAKRLGADMADSFHLHLAKPLDLSQEEFLESWGGQEASSSFEQHKPITEFLSEKTLSVSVAVRVTFELKAVRNNNNNNRRYNDNQQ